MKTIAILSMLLCGCTIDADRSTHYTEQEVTHVFRLVDDKFIYPADIIEEDLDDTEVSELLAEGYQLVTQNR